MRKFFVFLLFILSFFIDVHLRAEDRKGILTFPTECLKKNIFPCAVKATKDKSWAWSWGEGRIELAPEAVVVLASQASFQLVEGTVILYSFLLPESGVQTPSYAKLKTAYGDIRIKKGVALIEKKTEDRIELSALSGSCEWIPRGSAPLLLPSGYRSWLGPLEVNGMAKSGIPQVINKSRVFDLWPQLFAGEKKEYLFLMRDFVENWQKALEEGSIFHKNLVERRMASVQEDFEREKRRKKKIEEEKRALRDLFRRKNFLD